ncbi:MAG: hypothetical protein LAT51_04160 [Flavobacteriaceae bacterium]|nr:hypothetical protein [Flavobacteriaceae bacterium]
MRFFILLLLCTWFTSCSPILGSYTSLSKPSLNPADSVHVFTPEEELPENIQEVGGVKFSAQYIASCTLEKQLERIKREARKAGANLIKVEHFGKSYNQCFDTMLTLYYIEDDSALQNKDAHYNSHSEYAKLFIIPPIDSKTQKSHKHRIFINDEEVFLAQNTKYIQYIQPQHVDMYLIDDDFSSNHTLEAGKNYYTQVYYSPQRLQYEIKKIEPIIGRLFFENNSNQLTELEINYPDELSITELIQSEDLVSSLSEIEKSDFSRIRYSSSKNKDKDKEKDYNPFDFYVKSGLSNRLGRTTSGTHPEFKNIIDDFRRGLFIELNANYFFDATNGIGFTYSNSSSSSTQNIFSGFNIPGFNTSTLNGSAKADLQINYYGVNYVGRYKLKEKSNNVFTFNVGLGLLDYRELYSFANGSLSFETTSIALNSSISYDFQIVKNLYLGVNLGLVLSSSDKMTISNGVKTETRELNESVAMSRIDIGAGLRYSF